MKFVWIPVDETGSVGGFWMSETEVTWKQWMSLIPEGNASQTNHPARKRSWNQFKAFIALMNQQFPNYFFRFPTEHEWEYAARAGSEDEWFFGNTTDSLHHYGWTRENANGQVQPARQKRPNPWGLYDIYGNVWEYVDDDYIDEKGGPTTLKIRKGGSAVYSAQSTRTSYTYHQPIDRGNGNIGARIVMEIRD